MKTKRHKGLTLIELVIAMAVNIIVLLAVGMILVIGHRTWNEAWKDANLQRDASYTMLRICHPIKTAISAQVVSDGKAIKVYREADWIRFFLVDGSKDLKYQIEGKPEIILDDKVENLEFNVEGNRVTIDLKLKEDNLQTHLVSTVMMRNYGG